MFQRLPEEILADGGRTLCVGMGEGVAMGWGGSPGCDQGARVDLKLVSEVIQSEAVDHL